MFDTTAPRPDLTRASLLHAARATLAALATLGALAAPAAAQRVYVVNVQGQFGTVDLATGAFQQIGANLPSGAAGLAPGPNGTLLTLLFTGDLAAIDPTTGAATVVGSTGLEKCLGGISSTPGCGPTAENALGGLAGTTYATDLRNTLYRVNAQTGAATAIGATGMPAVPFIPGTANADGSENIYDEALFGAGGSLFATLQAATLNFGTGAFTPLVPPQLYRIDPTTGHATTVGSTGVGIGAVAAVNGAYVGFANGTRELRAIDLASGNTVVVGQFAPAAGIVDGAYFAPTATPEPASLALVATGLCGLAYVRRRTRRA